VSENQRVLRGGEAADSEAVKLYREQAAPLTQCLGASHPGRQTAWPAHSSHRLAAL
jgi:hypothetical protein